MEINKTTIDQVIVFEVSGRIDANTAKDFENALTQSIEEGATKMIVDLTNADYISSSGLRVFLLIAKKLDKNGYIYLCSLQPQVSQIFNISGFNNIFSIFENKDAALDNAK